LICANRFFQFRRVEAGEREEGAGDSPQRSETAKLAVRYSRVQNSVLAGNTLFAMAALTVNIGSFTTWLNRKCIATLQSR
jgi:hypothetical protein